jgi:hypothetical protein
LNKRITRRLVAATLAVFAVLLGSTSIAQAVTPRATAPNGMSILYVSNGGGAHTCHVIGTVDGYSGVVCADLRTSPCFELVCPNTEYQVEAGVEVYCQNSAGVVVECASAVTIADLGQESKNVSGAGFNCTAGTSTPCSSGRNIIWTGPATLTESAPACYSNPSGPNAVWGTAANTTEIRLPVSGQWVQLSTSSPNDGQYESTGHVYICP